MSSDRPLLGIALMFGFCALAPLADAMAKLAATSTGIFVITVARFAVQAGILVPLTLATGRQWRMGRDILGFVALRTALHIAGITTMVAALSHLPLADAIAIAFVMPFVMLLLGHWVLGEEVGWRRIAACAVGFVGTLMVMQPAFADVGWPALLPLAVAVIFALFMLVTRHVARRVDPVGMQAVSALMALAVLLPVLGLGSAIGWTPLAWRTPDAGTLILLAGTGAAGAGAHLLMTWSLRHAPASTLAPMQYLEIPMATLIGWLLFSDLPGPLASAGIAVTVAAGLYVILRERATARARPAAPFPAHSGTPPAG